MIEEEQKVYEARIRSLQQQVDGLLAELKRRDGPPLRVSKGNKGYKWEEIKQSMSDEEYERFCEFMEGQTVGIGDDGESFVWQHDFKRFRR